MASRRKRSLSTEQAVRVEGLRELDRQLASLGKATRKRATNAALLKAAEPIKDEARRLTPRSDSPGGSRGVGHAADNIEARVVDDGEVHVGPTEKFWYLIFTEFGTPNQPARAPLRTAADTKYDDAIRRFRDEQEKQLRRAL